VWGCGEEDDKPSTRSPGRELSGGVGRGMKSSTMTISLTRSTLTRQVEVGAGCGDVERKTINRQLGRRDTS
jgi:hypothetical protein